MGRNQKRKYWSRNNNCGFDNRFCDCNGFLCNPGGINMKKYAIVLILVSFLFSMIPFEVFAHPGRTNSKGCHFCRTNCRKWRVKQGKQHCHSKKNISKITSKQTSK